MLRVLFLALAELSAQSPAKSPPEAPSAAKPETCLDVVPEAMACIPAGPFVRGTNDGPPDTRPQATVWLQTFYMDLYEVTVERYEACVARGGCKPAKTAYSDYSRPKQPKVGITWFHAEAFCRADGKHLPTEAEWEKAARGPDGNLHPWGNEPASCERAIIMDARGRSCGVKKLHGQADKGRTFEVGPSHPCASAAAKSLRCGRSWRGA
jgi:formylglycine-generating enzyme required for sulfatase activity